MRSGISFTFRNAKILRNALTMLVIWAALALPATAQGISYETWDLPGQGASTLVVNPADGSLWTFCHQTENLVAFDPSDGSVKIDIPLTLRPTALSFTADGSVAFIVGEPLGDQIITAGVIQALDPTDGSVIGEIGVEGACNAVYASEEGELYVACGMQYAYQGIIYRLAWQELAEGGISIEIMYQADCGKVPWAIAEYEGILYITDLELQWTAQADGSEGPPYGAYVWAYDAETLEVKDLSWVGINPSRLGVMSDGVIVACSGSKQTEGQADEPTLSIIDAPGASEPVYIGTAGASDLAVTPDGTTVLLTLADWGPPAPWSAMATIQNLNPGMFTEARRWLFTGDIGIIKVVDGETITERKEILPQGYLRAIAISSDGSVVYALKGDPEQIVVIPIDSLIF